jgi:hypothetical protein
MKKTSELLVETTLKSGILNYFLCQGDFIALGRIRIRIRFFSEVGSGYGQNGPDPPTTLAYRYLS